MANESRDENHRAALDLLIRGFQVSRLLRLVADLDVADRISREGSRSVEELAAACGVQAAPLLRALRALSAFGIFRIRDGMIAHTPRSLLLRTDTADSLHYAARFWTAPGSWQAWGALDAALRGGNPHQAAWGVSRFDYLRRHPDEARIFDAFMAHFTDDRHHSIAQSYDFSRAALIADIGGGNGETLRRVLALFPAPRGVVYDREDVIDAIPPEALLSGRMTAEGGDFFERVPQGADLYLLIRVLHNWSDEDCLRILRTCRRAMRPDARLLIGEQILEVDPSRGRATDYLVDLQMMAMYGCARERTEAEFRSLLAASGFSLVRLIPTGSPVSILEIAPA
ncbi:MAG TPA: methyltransferase [Burkholderiales bacterium]|nr:methyltransferase [Burkholderiales bacterium]